eukprot:285311_1
MSSRAATEVPYMTYTWQIPSISPSKQKTLCCGYTREQIYTLYKMRIPSTIIQLFALYFTPNDDYTFEEILDAPLQKEFNSPVFDMYGAKLAIAIIPHRDTPDNTVCGVRMLSLSGYHMIKAHMKLSNVECNSSQSGRVSFTSTQMDWGSKDESLQLNKLKKYQQATFCLKFVLLEVIDKKQKNITKKIMSTVERKYSQSLIIKHEECNIQFNEMSNWLINVVKLGQYLDNFIDSGFEELLTVKWITFDMLKEIGINKIGHRLKIMHSINMLNGNKNNNCLKRTLENENIEGQNHNHNQPPCKKQKT